jgi:hypothetical protein
MATIHRLPPPRGASSAQRRPPSLQAVTPLPTALGERCREIWADTDLLTLATVGIDLSPKVCGALSSIERDITHVTHAQLVSLACELIFCVGRAVEDAAAEDLDGLDPRGRA